MFQAQLFYKERDKLDKEASIKQHFNWYSYLFCYRNYNFTNELIIRKCVLNVDKFFELERRVNNNEGVCAMLYTL